MRRGTTPTIRVTVESDISDMTIYLAFKQSGHVMVKSGDDLSVSYDSEADETTVECRLTQADTLSMKPGSDCEVQIRAVTDGGETAIATTIGRVTISKILQEGVLDG